MRRLIAYSSLFAMLANLNVMTITFFVTAIPSVAYAEQSETPLLDRLRERYRLDNPSRNHHTEEAFTSEFQRPTSHAPTETMQRMLDLNFQRDIRGLPSGDKEIDQQRYWRMAAGAGRTHTGPRLNEDGSLRATHTDRATREYYRDENGQLQFRVIENADEIQYRNNGLSQVEMFSQELESEGVRFGADQIYGDEEGYYEEGRISHAQLTDTNVRTGESFAYRAVTNNPNRALNTSVNENILQPGFSYLRDSNRQGGGFFGACQDTESTNRRVINVDESTFEYCYDTGVSNPHFCEISQHVPDSGISLGDNVYSCGEGCFEVRLHNPLWSTSRICRNSWQSNQDIGEGLRSVITTYGAPNIKSVQVNVTETHDHFMVSFNGEPIVMNDRRDVVYDTNTLRNEDWFDHFDRATQPFGHCNISGHAFETEWVDITNRFLEIADGASNEGFELYQFQGYVAWGGAGAIDVRIRIEFEEDLTESEVTYEQHPAGCYDRAQRIKGKGGENQCEISCPSVINRVMRDHATNLNLRCDGINYGIDYENSSCLYHGFDYAQCETRFGSIPAEESCSDANVGLPEWPESEPFELTCTYEGYSPLEQGTRGLPGFILDKVGPLYPGDTGNKTWRANLDGYRCNPLGEEEYCPNPEMPESCISYEELQENPSTCGPLIEDSACSEVDRVCADDMFDEVHDICWMESVRFRCEDGNEFVREETVITNSCESMLPCVGGECYQVEPETSDKFEQAVGMASLLEDAGAEGCINDDGNAECTIFDGEVRECRYDLTGLIPNCCKDQSGTSIIQYVAFAKQSMRVEQMAYKGEFGAVVQGAWAPIRDGASSAWQSLPFTSPSESIEGAAEAALSDNSWIANKMMEVIYNYMPESWAQVFVTNTASQGGDVALEWSEGFGEFAEVFGNVFGTIMAYYQAYQALKLALNVLYACPSSQLDMGALIAGGQCFEYRSRTSRARLVPATIWYTEHYCCYSSTLARIVMEQVHEIENIPLNQCAGLTPDLLETLDWDRIDFSEWVDLMFAADLMMEESMDGLTGSGRTLNNLNEDEDALTECPSGWEQDSPTSCVRYAGNANTSCPSSLEWDDWDADFGQFTCSIPYQRETDSSCVYSSRQIVIGYHEGEDGELIPVYRMCSADPQPKSNYGCPEGFSREDGICTARMQLAPSQRMNAVERTQERFDFDLDETRRENIRQTREPIDCSQVPRPPICNYGFDPSN